MDDHQWCLLQFSVIFSRVSLSISDSDKVWKQILWVVSITSAAKMFHDGHAQKYEESSTRLSCVKNGLRDCELINNNRPLDWQKKISFYLAATLDLLIPLAILLSNLQKKSCKYYCDTPTWTDRWDMDLLRPNLKVFSCGCTCLWRKSSTLQSGRIKSDNIYTQVENVLW